MKNQHLIPANVIDLVEKINFAGENEKTYLLQRLEAIRDYCDYVLIKANNPTKNLFDKKTKSKLNYSRVGKNNV
jgi:hypothetical protein